MDLVLVPVEVFVAILVAAIAMIALLATARITGATCLQAARRAAESTDSPPPLRSAPACWPAPCCPSPRSLSAHALGRPFSG
jgi:hypothetical protein